MTETAGDSLPGRTLPLLNSEMPQNNPRLTPDQKIAALAWQAACEKLHHFLCATPGYPELAADEVVYMMDTTESVFFELRRTFEVDALAKTAGIRGLGPADEPNFAVRNG